MLEDGESEGCYTQPLWRMEGLRAQTLVTPAEGQSCTGWEGHRQLGDRHGKDECDSQRAPCLYTVSQLQRSRSSE